MDSILVEGGIALNGEINISGAKNAALPIMSASLLTGDSLILENIPKLSDVDTMITLLQEHGVDVIAGSTNVVSLTARHICNFCTPDNIVSKMRASIWVLGPLLSRFGKAKLSLPGGCAIGARKIDLHLNVLEALGAKILVKNGYIIASANKRLSGAVFYFNKVSVGATINAIMAATLATGKTCLYNCAKEPEIVDLCECLIKMGAKIDGVGTSTINVIGVDQLYGAKYRIIPDRIEAGTYMIAAAITKGNLKLNNVIPTDLDPLTSKLQSSGVIVKYGSNSISVSVNDNIKATNVQTNPYPGFSTDFQAQFMSLMTIADGVSIITENIFENRYKHVSELIKMGANININGKHAIVKGVKQLRAAEVVASDLRASVSLVLAGLAAEGVTKVNKIYHLDRGYELLAEKFQKCGARIKRISN